MKARCKMFAPNQAPEGDCQACVIGADLAVISIPITKPYRSRSLAFLLASLILLSSALLASARAPVQVWVQRYGAQSVSGGSQAVAPLPLS